MVAVLVIVVPEAVFCANAVPDIPIAPSATAARPTRRICLKTGIMGTPLYSLGKKSVQHGAEARERGGAGLQGVLELPADVLVFIGARGARGAVLLHGELAGRAEGLAVER